jgi:hypothetical protein
MTKSTVAYHELLFGIRRSVRYHASRRRFLDQLHKLSNFLTLLSGTGIFISVLSNLNQLWMTSAAFLIITLSLIDLVIDAPGKARLHNDLERRFLELEKCTISNKNPTQDDIISFESSRLEIEADEPPILKVLDIICHNELSRALGYDKSNFYHVSWYQSLFCQIIDIRSSKIEKEKSTCL